MADFAKENQFTPDQQAEIDAGIKDNIDVSIYAKPEFLAIQMHEIRILFPDLEIGRAHV